MNMKFYSRLLSISLSILFTAGCAQNEIAQPKGPQAGAVQANAALPPGQKYSVSLGAGRINSVCVISNASYTNYAHVVDEDPNSNYVGSGFGTGEHTRIFSAMNTFGTNKAEIWAMNQPRTIYLPMRKLNHINANRYTNTCGWRDNPFNYFVFGFEDAGGPYTSYDDVMIIFANVVP